MKEKIWKTITVSVQCPSAQKEAGKKVIVSHTAMERCLRYTIKCTNNIAE